MQHLETVDINRTVVMVQVENECGILGDSRDRSEAATRTFESPVPDDLVEYLVRESDILSAALKATLSDFTGKRGLTWVETFGEGNKVDELFMAYHYARYLETVTAAGKRVYGLPMFTNVWLANDEEDTAEVKAGGGTSPGVYPSGGPVAVVLDIWQRWAPSLDFIAPDIYMMDYETTCATYRIRQQPLFIPEQRRDENGALRLWSAIGTYQALGVSPFGIDTIPWDKCAFTSHYTLLATVSPLILAARQESRQVYGFYLDHTLPGFADKTAQRTVTFGEWRLTITSSLVFGKPKAGYGMVIQLSENEFLLIGEGYQVRFEPSIGEAILSGLSMFREQEVVGENGELKDGRWLNGDETVARDFQTVARMPSSEPDYGDAFIAILTPARTKIAKVRPYALFE